MGQWLVNVLLGVYRNLEEDGVEEIRVLVVAHSFSPSTLEAEAGVSLSCRPASATQ